MCLEIEPRQLDPVEFIVSGSLTGQNNNLEPNSNGTMSYARIMKQSTTPAEALGFTTARTMDTNESYAPYFILALRDHNVREGHPILFEITVSGNSK